MKGDLGPERDVLDVIGEYTEGHLVAARIVDALFDAGYAMIDMSPDGVRAVRVAIADALPGIVPESLFYALARVGVYIGLRPRLRQDLFSLADQSTLAVHPPDRCAGEWCCIHNPSRHPLMDAPLVWHAPARVMRRRCRHGQDHPDVDDLAYQARLKPESAHALGQHFCDGCCGLVWRGSSADA